MRILRIICILILGVVIGMLLLYASGWRRPVPTVWLVNPDLTVPYALPALNQGQVLKWRGTKGSQPFEVQFPYGGPCGTTAILSDDKDEPGVQVATCKVGVVNAAQSYRYDILPQPAIKTSHPWTVIPCDGCQFFPIAPPVSYIQKSQLLKKITPPSYVYVGCDESQKTFDVINPDYTDTYQATVGQPVIWETVGDSASFTLDLGAEYGKSVSCDPDPRDPKNPVAGTACTFNKAIKDTYTAKDGDANTVCTNPSGSAYVNAK